MGYKKFIKHRHLLHLQVVWKNISTFYNLINILLFSFLISFECALQPPQMPLHLRTVSISVSFFQDMIYLIITLILTNICTNCIGLQSYSALFLSDFAINIIKVDLYRIIFCFILRSMFSIYMNKLRFKNVIRWFILTKRFWWFC